MSEIREFRRADAEAVAALFQRTFRDPEAAPPAGLVAYFIDAYLEHPWFDPEIASRVHVNGEGRVTGFVGVFPRRFRHGAETLRGAIAGSLMVEHPEREPLAGAKLLRSVIKGPQDITISETTNAVSQALWERLGGSIVPLLSLDWMRSFRPAATALSLLSEQRPALQVLAPAARLGDRIARIWTRGRLMPAEAPRHLAADTAPDDAAFAVAVATLSASYDLRPDWSAADIGWLLAHAARKERYGDMHRAIVRDARGDVAGCYLYHGRRDGTGRVLQALAAPGMSGAVFDCLFAHAGSAGLAALRGRLGADSVEALLMRGCVFMHRSSTAVHSRRAELTAAAIRGAALVTGLAGEGWSRFLGGTFL